MLRATAARRRKEAAMSNRFVLNNISYHGAGAIKEIPGELTRRGFSKAFVATDADLVRFGVTKKDRKSTRQNSSHRHAARMPSSA